MSIQHQHEAFGLPRLWRRVKPTRRSRSSPDNLCLTKMNLPWWRSRILNAQALVLITKLLNVLLVPVLLEHFICFLLVESAAHAAVCGVHCEDAGAIHCVPLPYAALDQGPWFYKWCGLWFANCKFVKMWMNTRCGWCNVENIKAWQLRVPE